MFASLRSRYRRWRLRNVKWAFEPCFQCLGSGWDWAPAANGEGYVPTNPCECCGGSGILERTPDTHASRVCYTHHRTERSSREGH
jgi:hypothetical protein